MELTAPFAALLGAVLGGVLSQLGNWLLARRQGRKLSAEALQAGATAAEKFAALVSEQTTQIDGLRSQVAELKAALAKEVAERERISRVLPFLIVHRRLLPVDEDKIAADTEWLLDKSVDLWAITSPVDRGLVLWVNAAWEIALGRPRTAMLGEGWTKLMHPADLEEARKVEASAWHGRIDGAVLRYRHGQDDEDGSPRWVSLRWFVVAYKEGGTWALAVVEDAL